MRNLISVAFFLSILGQLCQSVFASDISSPAKGFFLLSGEIKKGDAEKLAKSFIQSHTLNANLTLDSTGGDVKEALRIASFVKALHFKTSVAGGGICASACFFIFLASDEHIAAGTIDGKMIKQGVGYIGLHRPHLDVDPTMRNGSNDAEARQHDLMQIISTYLRNQAMPQRIIDLMMSRPSNDIYWMTNEDIEQLGSYSPGREELLISRCGYNRNLYNDVVSEMVSNMTSKDSIKTAGARARLEAFNECSENAFPDLIEETVKNAERLRKGWRPW